MPAWNDHVTEREEATYLTMRAELGRAVGEERFEEFIDAMILRYRAVLVAHGAPDNPAVIRLRSILARRENGFE
jgi:hypothetical protein